MLLCFCKVYLVVSLVSQNGQKNMNLKQKEIRTSLSTQEGSALRDVWGFGAFFRQNLDVLDGV